MDFFYPKTDETIPLAPILEATDEELEDLDAGEIRLDVYETLARTLELESELIFH